MTKTREVGRAPKEHFKLVFGSGTSDLAKIRPLKIWTSWISPWVPPYGILPLYLCKKIRFVSQRIFVSAQFLYNQFSKGGQG